MEYRAHITIPNFPVSHQNTEAFRLLEWLDERTDMGPVMAGPGPGDTAATIALATAAASEAIAAAAMVGAVAQALQALGLGHLYPTEVLVEPADEQVPA